MSSIALVVNDRIPHFKTSDGYKYDVGRGLTVAVARTQPDGALGKFQLKSIEQPSIVRGPDNTERPAWSLATPSALYVSDGLMPPRLYVTTIGAEYYSGLLHTLSKGLASDDVELIVGCHAPTPLYLSWADMRANVVFMRNMRPFSTCIAQRHDHPDPDHPSWGNWTVLTVRPEPDTSTVDQRAFLTLESVVLCFYGEGNAWKYSASDPHNCVIAVVSSDGYRQAANDTNIEWTRYQLGTVMQRFGPAPLFTNDGSNKVYVFVAGTDGYLWMIVFAVDDDGYPTDLSSDKTVINTTGRKIPGTYNRVASTPSPVLYNNRLYAFYRGTNSSVEYVSGDANGVVWSGAWTTNVPLTPEDQIVKLYGGVNVGGVSAVVVDDSFLEGTSML